MTGEVVVRRAVYTDAEALEVLGRALAQQHADPTTEFTAEAIRRDAFGDHPKFEGWIAIVDGSPVGYAAVVVAAYETAYAQAGAYVQDLFVRPEFRRRGAGRALMAAIAADTRRRGLTFLWWVSRAWNGDAHAFFRTFASAEEPVVAFATFGERFTMLADEGERGT